MLRKKFVLISAAGLVVIAAGILAAIFLGNRNNDVPQFAKETNNIINSELPEAKLTFYFEAQEPKDASEVLAAIEKRARNELNIKLEFKYFWDYPEVYLKSVRSVIAAGQPCDAFYFSNGFPQTLGSLAEEGDIKDITDTFSKYAPNYYSKLSPDEIRSAAVKGRIYAIPHRYYTAGIQSIIVREDLMKKYNIPDIKTYEDYEVYLKAVKENEKTLTPMVVMDTTIGLFARANGYTILDYQQGLVYRQNDPQMKIMAWEQTPEFKSGIQRISSWYSKGYLLKGTPVWNVDSKAISSGKWASVIGYYGNQYEYNEALKKNGINWEYKAYPLYPDKPSSADSPMAGALAVGKNSSNAERVLMFVDWLQSHQENYDSLMYGIEGKNYTLVDGQIKIPDGTRSEDSCLNWGWRWPFENPDFERSVAGQPKDLVDDYFSKVRELSKYPPHTGFVPDYTSVKDITNRRQVSFYSLDQSIYTGSFKQADVDKYIQDQKDSDIGLLISEVQKQLDEWKAGNAGLQ